jgi:hypothetical protein
MSHLKRRFYLDQRSNVLVFHSALALDLVESSSVATISHRLVLKITLSSLIANGAVERVVSKEKLHDTFSGLVDEGRVCLDHHSWLYGPCARRNRLGGPLYLDQAHTTTSSNHQLLMVTVSWDGSSGFFAGLDEGGAGCSGH